MKEVEVGVLPYSWSLSGNTERVLITLLFALAGGVSHFGFGLPMAEVWPWYGALAVLWLLALGTHYAFFSSTSGRQRRSKIELLDLITETLSVVAWSMNARSVVTDVHGCNIRGDRDTKDNSKGLCANLIGETADKLSQRNSEFGILLYRAMGGEAFVATCDIGPQTYQHTFTPRMRYGVSAGFDCVSTEVTGDKGQASTVDLWEQMFEHSVDAVMLLDKKRRVFAINKAFTEITGFEEAEALGQRDNLLLSKPPGENYYKVVFDHLENADSWNGEVSIRHKSGRLFTVNMTVSVIKTSLGRVRHYLALFSDVSQRKQAEDELRHLANHDNLTGLPNRRLFLDRLDQSLHRVKRSHSRLAVLFLDADNFKLINDAYGHDVGDAVLKEIAVRLQAAVRESDTVARLSGDEFTIIADNIRDQDEAIAVARKVMACFEAPFELPDQQLNVSGSVGIALYPDDGDDVVSLMKHADQAMYRAKAEGRNGFYSISDERPTQVSQGPYYPSELRLAVKRGQMKVVYQPQLSLSDGHLVGCESFLRWEHHCRGNIRPSDFMTVSEEAGITENLGSWTLDTVASQLGRWLELGVPVDYIAVNVAMSQIKSSNFPALVCETLLRHKLPASSLMLEVAEDDYLRNRGVCNVFFAQLKKAGIRSCIDQFGSHTSDYTYIKDIPVDTVKINQASLAKAYSDKNDRSFFRALVALCKVLGKEVIAVSVERSVQENQVREIGCDTAQGYLYGKPMAASEVQKFYSMLEPTSEQRIN
ncbi:MAG: diguanylate cyclase [Porticoccaceae bacterium]|nr:diguanylate cyclase [Porticoccaceae bacterium]